MNERYIEIIQQFIHHWKLNRATATLISTAMVAVAKYHDNLDRAKAHGILMAYNAAGMIDENTYQEGHNLLDRLMEVEAETEREALDFIFNYFDECDR